MDKVAVLYIATGRYISFWKDFYRSCEKFFLPDYEKDYYIFTDSKRFAYSNKKNVKITYQEKLGWPYDTMMRFDMFLKRKTDLQNYDYIFFFNANIKFLKTVGKEVLPSIEQDGLVVQTHPGVFDLEPDKFSYDRNPASKAYIPYGEGKHYYAGGLNGGIAKDYLEMCEYLSNWTHIDLDNGIIPLWHDESMINKYMLDKNPLVLPVNYMLPEEYLNLEKYKNFLYEQKTVLRSKQGNHDYFRGITNKKRVYLKKKIKKFLQGKSNEVVIPLYGRLANNMFQWGFARWYENETGISPVVDVYNLQYSFIPFEFKSLKYKKYFRIKKNFLLSLLSVIPFTQKTAKKYIKEMYNLPVKEELNFLKFEEGYKKLSSPIRLEGYFQSYKYLEPVREKLLKDFKLKVKLTKENCDILEKIKQTESVSVHYRRTDYLNNQNQNFYYACSDEYYKTAVNYIADETNKNIVLFVFSDDIEWVKENVKFEFETVFVDINSSEQGYFDLELMKNCKHNIIANSSFSYMAAWLNENDEKIVVCPEKWYRLYESTYDLYPPQWKQIGGQV